MTPSPRWSESPSETARPSEGPTDLMPGDPGYEYAEPETRSAPRPSDEVDTGSKGLPFGLSLPAFLIVIAVVLALLIGGMLWWRTNRMEPTPPPGQGVSTPGPGQESQLQPRTGEPPVLQEAAIGQRVHVQGLYGTGWITVVTSDWSSEGDIAPERGSYLNLDLLVEVEEGTMVIDPIQYAAYDLQANEYLPTIGAGKTPFLEKQQIGDPGAEARGWISFDAPRGATRVVLADEGMNPLVQIDILPPA